MFDTQPVMETAHVIAEDPRRPFTLTTGANAETTHTGM